MKKFFITLAALFIGAFALCSCATEKADSDNGEFYTLQEAYESNFITVNDLMHISYFKNGEVYKVEPGGDFNDSSNWEKVEFVPEKNLTLLDNETENAIKTAFYNKHIEYFKDGKDNIRYGKDILKIKFLGSYGGNYAVEIDSDKWNYCEVVRTVCVGGIVWNESGPVITVYK